MRFLHPVIVVAISIGAAALAAVIGNDYYLRIGFMMCVYYLCAAGMNVLVGYAGQKSLGQAGLFAAGAYSAALLSTSFDLNAWVALAAAAIIAGLCGVLIAWPSLRVRGPYLAMVTLAFGIVVEKLVSEWTEVFGGAQGILGIKPLSLAGIPFANLQWVWFGIALGAIAHLLLRNLLSGRFGRAFLSLQADEIAAESVGVSVYRYKILAFVIAAVTCGVAGAMVAQQNQYLNSDFISFQLSIFILLLVLFGGSGSLYGPLIGAVSLTLIDALLARWPPVQHFAYGGLLLFALYAMPNGVAGLFSRLFTKKVRPVSAAQKQSSPPPPRRDEDRSRPPPAWPCACSDWPEWSRQEHDDQYDQRCPHAKFGPNCLSWRRDRRSGKPRHLSPWCRPDVSEPAPVREPFGARERLARSALPHEERLLGLVTGATTSSP